MTEIRVPKLNTNDDEYTLIEWIVPPGALVRAGDPVATVETSKAAEELPAPGPGHLRQLLPVGTVCAVGAVIGQLTPAPDADAPTAPPACPPAAVTADRPGAPGAEIPNPPSTASSDRPDAAAPGVTRAAVPGESFSGSAGAAVPDVSGVPAPGVPAPDMSGAPRRDISDISHKPGLVITEPALRAMAERGISRADVEALGRKVIRVADLDALPAPGRATGERLPPVQRAVAAVVTASARDIPQAFVAMRVPVDAAVARGRELSRRYHRLIGLPELTIAAIGAAAAGHPDCFAAFVPPDRVRRAAAVDVGVTVDVGQGLHVPVIRDVPGLSLAEIAERLMRLRTTALRGAFRPADLAAPAILLALHTDPDVTAAVPLVLPGTTCALALTGRVDGYAQLGLAYDHRVVNGRGATLFLKAVAASLAV